MKRSYFILQTHECQFPISHSCLLLPVALFSKPEMHIIFIHAWGWWCCIPLVYALRTAKKGMAIAIACFRKPWNELKLEMIIWIKVNRKQRNEWGLSMCHNPHCHHHPQWWPQMDIIVSKVCMVIRHHVGPLPHRWI